jgi:hypothetical protein
VKIESHTNIFASSKKKKYENTTIKKNIIIGNCD